MTVTSDLLICLITISVVSAGLFVSGMRIGSHARRGTSIAIACLAMFTLIAYGLWLTDNPIQTRIMPVANVLLWGNVQLPAAALLGGIAWSTLKTPIWQRLLLIVTLVAIGLWRECGPLIGSPPPIGPPRWTNGVCRQTSTSSCSAAAAATLLRLYSIRATEAEMIARCLTHVEGTTTLGLYRGLKLKTVGTNWTVWAGTPARNAIDHWPLPAVVTLALPGLKTEILGLGVGHSVVVLGRDAAGNFDIADPFVGRQKWTRQQLIDAYGGDLMTLVATDEDVK